MKYAILNSDGIAIQWVNDSTITELPDNASLLSDEQWKNRFIKSEEENQIDRILSLKNSLLFVRMRYLSSTDWQAAAFVKYDRPIDSGVKDKCKLANKEINEIEVCTTLEELNNYSIEF